MLFAILLGNLVYFLVQPYLPDVLVHQRLQVDVGLIVDFSVCLLVYTLIRKVVLTGLTLLTLDSLLPLFRERGNREGK